MASIFDLIGGISPRAAQFGEDIFGEQDQPGSQIGSELLESLGQQEFIGKQPTVEQFGGFSGIRSRLEGLGLDQQALGALRSQALTPGLSQAGQLQLDQQAIEEATLRDRAARQAASGTAQAQAGLARRGGLTSGARERVASSGARDLLGLRQQVARQGSGQRGGIRLQDELTRQQTLRALPGLESQAFKTLQGREQSLIGLGGIDQQRRLANAQLQAGFDARQQQFELGKFDIASRIKSGKALAEAQEGAASKSLLTDVFGPEGIFGEEGAIGKPVKQTIEDVGSFFSSPGGVIGAGKTLDKIGSFF